MFRASQACSFVGSRHFLLSQVPQLFGQHRVSSSWGRLLQRTVLQVRPRPVPHPKTLYLTPKSCTSPGPGLGLVYKRLSRPRACPTGPSSHHEVKGMESTTRTSLRRNLLTKPQPFLGTRMPLLTRASARFPSLLSLSPSPSLPFPPSLTLSFLVSPGLIYIRVYFMLHYLFR